MHQHQLQDGAAQRTGQVIHDPAQPLGDVDKARSMARDKGDGSLGSGHGGSHGGDGCLLPCHAYATPLTMPYHAIDANPCYVWSGQASPRRAM